MSGLLKVDSITNNAGTGAPSIPNAASSISLPSDALNNLGIATSFATNAMTVSLKQADGTTDPASGGAVTICMRSATLASGSYNQRNVTAATSLVVASGATLGSVSAQPVNFWVYAMDNSGTIELAISGRLFREDTLMTTTALSGSSNTFSTVYSTTARTSLPFRLIGKIVITQTTAGTWVSSPTQIQVAPLALSKVPTIQSFITAGSGTYFLPTGCTYIRVRIGGAGGGGAGSGNSAGGAGGSASSTTFGTGSPVSGGGGGAGVYNSSGGQGGVASTGAGSGYISNGNDGIAGTANSIGAGAVGGEGGNNPVFGGLINSRTYNQTGSAANPGAGGVGGANNQSTTSITGSGGGSGAYVSAYISGVNLAASYSYSVASGGTAGAAGTGGPPLAGGAGGNGLIYVEEFYD